MNETVMRIKKCNDNLIYCDRTDSVIAGHPEKGALGGILCILLIANCDCLVYRRLFEIASEY